MSSRLNSPPRLLVALGCALLSAFVLVSTLPIVQVVEAAITYDTITSAALGGTGTTLTFNATTNTGSTVIAVCVASRNGSTPDQPTGVTFGGDALTKAIGIDDTATYGISSIWYKFTPQIGTLSTVVTYAGTQSDIVAHAVSLKGTDTSALDDTGSAFVGAALTISLSNLVTVAADAAIVDCLAETGSTDPTMTTGTNRTKRGSNQYTGVNGWGSTSTVITQASPGTNAMEWTIGVSNGALTAVSFKPAAAAGFSDKTGLLGIIKP